MCCCRRARKSNTAAQGLAAEMEILAKDLLKIDRSAKKMRELVEAPTQRDIQFFSEIENFVNKYVARGSVRACDAAQIRGAAGTAEH